MQNTSVVEQGSEISTRYIFLEKSISRCSNFRTIHPRTYHSQVYALIILKGIKQSNQPLALCRGENITLSEHVADFVEFEQELLAHNLQGTHFAGVLFLCQIDLSIATLSDLG